MMRKEKSCGIALRLALLMLLGLSLFCGGSGSESRVKRDAAVNFLAFCYGGSVNLCKYNCDARCGTGSGATQVDCVNSCLSDCNRNCNSLWLVYINGE